jgi:hypothetical protein
MAVDNSIGVHAVVGIVDENRIPGHILGGSAKLSSRYLKQAWFIV